MGKCTLFLISFIFFFFQFLIFFFFSIFSLAFFFRKSEKYSVLNSYKVYDQQGNWKHIFYEG